MNNIYNDKAQCWCSRLNKLLKDKNYTQQIFLKEYKEKYGGGTQANISRWLRVGNKIQNGKTIGFPSYETMMNLANFFGVTVGYLTGETDYESFDMEKVCRFIDIDEETIKAIKGITSGKSVEGFTSIMADEYKAVLHYILTASSFPEFIKIAREYAESIYRQKHPINYMGRVAEKMNGDLYSLALQCIEYQCISDDKQGEIDDFKENNVEPTEELIAAIHLLQRACEDDYHEEQIQEANAMLSEYKLLKKYFDVVKEMVKEENLPDMAMPRNGEKDLADLKRQRSK